jgi:arsenate reductase
MKKILFICIGNACRSPMAEGFANYYGKSWLEASSAGLRYAGFISPDAITAMAEKGVDISSLHSRGLEEVDLATIDWIVTMDASIIGAIKPTSPRTKMLNWIVADPIGRPLDFYNAVRDQIEVKVLDLIEVIQNEERE